MGDVGLDCFGLESAGPKVCDPFEDSNEDCRQDGPRGLLEVGVV